VHHPEVLVVPDRWRRLRGGPGAEVGLDAATSLGRHVGVRLDLPADLRGGHRDRRLRRQPCVVQDGRPQLPMDQIKKLADGRIYTGDQAKASGLVDDIGYLEDAVELAKKKAGLTEARVVTYRRPGEYSNNVYSKLMTPGPLASLGSLDLLSFVRGGSPQFMYLWMP